MFSVIDVHEAADEKLYVEDVHSSFTYNGTGSAQSVVNGHDLAGKGGLVVLKGRSGATDWAWYDTARGATKDLVSNSTAAETTQAQGLTSFNSDGFSLGTLAKLNTSAATYVGWTFRKAPKFFDIVNYTGNGVAGRQIAHNLGIAPGMIVVKQIDGTGAWRVLHRSISSANTLTLNATDASVPASAVWNSTDPTDSVFTVGNSSAVNASGGTYVAYLFAHDTSADGIIQCGIWDGNSDLTLGWEPQFVLVKASAGVQDWRIFDTSRGFDLSASDKSLSPNISSAETSGSYVSPTATGLTSVLGAQNYVYLAIRKGLMRPPTDASKVFDIVARTGTGAAATITTPGIKTGPDLIISKQRSASRAHMWSDRLRGTASQLTSDSTAAETTVSTGVTSFNMDGVSVGSLNTVNVSAGTYINYMIKEAAGFFQRVAYTGTGVARTVPHNLGAVPELMIVKSRSAAQNWPVYSKAVGATQVASLNLTNAFAASASYWNDTDATDSVFTVGDHVSLNGSGANLIAYLFASCPGVSKIDTYTGTGTDQNVPCGFTAGARFVMIKRIDSIGSWYYFDTTRGIVSGGLEPYLLFNTTGAEVNANYLEPFAGGFGVRSSNVDINALDGKYLFLAIA